MEDSGEPRASNKHPEAELSRALLTLSRCTANTVRPLGLLRLGGSVHRAGMAISILGWQPITLAPFRRGRDAHRSYRIRGLTRTGESKEPLKKKQKKK